MDISVIEHLQGFEQKKQEELEQNKKSFLKELEEKRKELLDKHEMELYEITSGKHNAIKKAQEEAKREAMATITSFQEKTKLLQESSSKRIQQATDLIFQEFLKQNV